MHGGSRSDHGGGDEPMADLNLIPLIDISLTLLIILMVTSAFIQKPGVNLKLPQTATREGKPETAKDLVVSIGKNRAFYLGDRAQAVSDDALLARLRQTAGANADARLLIKGDRSVPYGRVMRALDLARQAGLTRVVLPTDAVPSTATAVGGGGATSSR